MGRNPMGQRPWYEIKIEQLENTIRELQRELYEAQITSFQDTGR